MHWAMDYIGQAWERHTHDCWAFVRRVQHERFGRELAPVDVDAVNLLACARAIDNAAERARWDLVHQPAEGDVALLARTRYPSHVGVWIDADGGGVLHCLEKVGVIFQGMRALSAAGWQKVEFYRWKGDACRP